MNSLPPAVTGFVQRAFGQEGGTRLFPGTRPTRNEYYHKRANCVWLWMRLAQRPAVCFGHGHVVPLQHVISTRGLHQNSLFFSRQFLLCSWDFCSHSLNIAQSAFIKIYSAHEYHLLYKPLQRNLLPAMIKEVKEIIKSCPNLIYVSLKYKLSIWNP